MDFASQLAKLQKSAAEAAASTRSSLQPGASSMSRSCDRGRFSSTDSQRKQQGCRSGDGPWHKNKRIRTATNNTYESPYTKNLYSKLDSLASAKSPADVSVVDISTASVTTAKNEADLFGTDRDESKNSDAIRPESSLSCKVGRNHHHVTLLFITIDDLPYEHIWRAWIEGRHMSLPPGITGSSNRTLSVSVIVHAKFPERVRSPWLRERLLTFPGARGAIASTGAAPSTHPRRERVESFRPSWGSVEITRAMIELLAEGLALAKQQEQQQKSEKVNDESNPKRYNTNPFLVTPTVMYDDISFQDSIPPSDRFIFVSETCIPIVSLDKFEEELFAITDIGCSWVNGSNEPNNGYSRQLQWEKMSPAIPASKIWKADQWIVLTRQHAEEVMSIPSKISDSRGFFDCFSQVRASDEMYFPTALALLGLIRRTENNESNNETSKTASSLAGTVMIGDNVMKRRVTYCDWSCGAKNPALFNGIKDLRKLINVARQENCLFARKFSGEIALQDWADVIKAQIAREVNKKQETQR